MCIVLNVFEYYSDYCDFMTIDLKKNVRLTNLIVFFSWIPGENDEYVFEENLLPDFPLSTPAAFQIFESDCKLNYALMDQLSFKFFENPNTNAEEFINENLNMMLTPMAASVYSWSGTQGYHPLAKFKCMKVLIGS